jgi:hypothetical protein
MLYSYWIFLAAVLYKAGVITVSTFPSSLLALPFGLFFVYGKYRVDPMWKLALAAAIHLVPFFLVPVDLSRDVLLWNLAGLGLWLLCMMAAGQNPVTIYRKTYYETHSSFGSLLSERLGLSIE